MANLAEYLGNRGLSYRYSLIESALLNQKFITYIKEQEYEKARAIIPLCLEGIERVETPIPAVTEQIKGLLRGATNSNRGVLYEALNQYDSAIYIHRIGLDDLQGYSDSHRSAAAFNIAGTYFKMNEYDSVKKYVLLSQQYMDIGLQEDAPELTKNYLLLSWVFTQESQPDSATFYLQKVLSLRSSEPDQLNLIESVPDFRTIEPDEYVFTALQNLGRLNVLWANDSPDSLEHLRMVVDYGKVSRDFLDSIREAGYLGIGADDFVASDTLAAHMEDGIAAAYRLSRADAAKARAHLEEALRFSEANKYNQLLYGIKRGELDQIDGIPLDSLDRERLLHNELAYLSSAIFAEAQNEASDSLINVLAAERKSRSLELDRLKAYLKREHPRYYTLRYAPNQPDLTDIQENLSSDQAILEFFYGKSHIYRFLITAQEVSMDVVALDAGLTESIDVFRRQASRPRRENPDYSALAKASHSLYQRMLSQPIGQLKAQQDQHWRISLIADGPLQEISWAAALTKMPQPDELLNPALWDFLVRDLKVTLSYQHSISIMMANRTRSNQTFDKDYAGFAAWYPQQDLAESRESVQELSLRDGWKADAFLGSPEKPLSKEEFLSRLGLARIYHLSMHGRADARDPMASSLKFSATDSLTVAELYQNNIPAQLIILDACETSLGQMRRGEGVLSLATGFAYAGAPATLASLWRVEDKSSRYLMSRFFAHLDENLPMDVAWQLAQVDYLSDYDGDKAPFYWASMVLIGNTEPIKSTSWGWWLLAGIAAAVAIGAYLYRARKRNPLTPEANA